MSRSAWLRVADMVDAARQVIAWTQGRTIAEFETDAMLASAVEWQLLVFGEAAKSVPRETRDAAPELNWVDVIRLRDFLAHGYAQLETATLWRIATEDLPRDLPALERLQARLAPEGEPDT